MGIYFKQHLCSTDEYWMNTFLYQKDSFMDKDASLQNQPPPH